jgi:hypothetical protein
MKTCEMRFAALGVVAIVLLAASSAAAQVSQLDPVQAQISQAVSSDTSMNVVPFEFDPNGLNLAQSSWLTGIGCAPNGGTDPGCAAGDPKDRRNEGLLLAKTGLTTNVVAAGARINGVKGIVIMELGYDVRKPLDTFDPRGSHCGAGAPRFNVVIAGAFYFVGCNSPVPIETPLGAGWIRLRWGGAVPLIAFGPVGPEDIRGKVVDSITIIFDEGQDTGPDNFGMAILDNIIVNTQIAGRGPSGGK